MTWPGMRRAAASSAALCLVFGLMFASCREAAVDPKTLARPLRFVLGPASAEPPWRGLILCGHLRGKGRSMSPEFVAAVPRLAAQSDTLVVLGDLTMNTSLPALAESVRDELLTPYPGTVWIAPGNHDVHDRSVLQTLVGGGPTFRLARAEDPSIALLILDTELNREAPHPAQREFLLTALQTCLDDTSVRHIVLCCHRFTWFVGHDRFRELLKHTNWGTSDERDAHYPPNDFWSEIFPRLRALREAGKSVVVAGGDCGFQMQTSWVVHEGIHFLATGMGEEGTGNSYLWIGRDGSDLVCEERWFVVD